MESVISVAYFAENEKIKNELLFYDEVRRKTLNKCYKSPEYENLPLEEKNKIYEKTRTKIEKELRKET